MVKSEARGLPSGVVPVAGVGVVLVTASGLGLRYGAGGAPIFVDQSWHDLMVGTRNAFADGLARVLNQVGGPTDMTVVVVAVVLLLLVFRRWRAGIFVLTTALLGIVASDTLKTVVGRLRPDDGLVAAGGNAFPSGHVTMAAALAVAIALLVRGPWAWTIASVWITVMAWSRTYLLVHWLTDTVAGAVLGASIAVIVYWLVFVAIRPASSSNLIEEGKSRLLRHGDAGTVLRVRSGSSLR